MDKLQLGVSFLGFPAQVGATLTTWMGAHGRDDCCWRAVPPAEADVWCINPVALGNGETGLYVRHQHPDGSLDRLDLARAPELLAVASEDFQGLAGVVRFDPAREASVIAAFRILESRLAVLRCDYSLGCSLVWHQEEVAAGGVYQLLFHSRLVAVMDLGRRVAAFPLTAQPGDLLRAEWVRRPSGAGRAPDFFIARTPTDLMWLYSSRTMLDILPTRYRRRLIHFRQMPRIAMEKLSAAHIRLVATLRAGPMTLSELALHMRAPEKQVARWVAALHAVNAVSAEPANASREASTPPVTASPFWAQAEPVNSLQGG